MYKGSIWEPWHKDLRGSELDAHLHCPEKVLTSTLIKKYFAKVQNHTRESQYNYSSWVRTSPSYCCFQSLFWNHTERQILTQQEGAYNFCRLQKASGDKKILVSESLPYGKKIKNNNNKILYAWKLCCIYLPYLLELSSRLQYLLWENQPLAYTTQRNQSSKYGSTACRRLGQLLEKFPF